MKCKYYNRRFDTLLKHCKRLYELEGCSAGGPLHILLDDDNYDDNCINFCLAQSLKHPDREVSKIGARICREYLKMSMEERSLFDWYWCGSDLECEWSSCEVCPFIGNDD